MTFTPTPDSSNIAGYDYDQAAKTLSLQFKSGAKYTYHAVEPTVVSRFADAESKGSFFAAHIRDKHKHTRADA